jgi:hypothetical protein
MSEGEEMTLFDYVEGRRLRDEGIKRAVDHADEKNEGWSDMAFYFLKEYCKVTEEFMTEDVRMWAQRRGLRNPTHRRAWGAVVVRAIKEGFIERKGYAPVKTATSHCTPASVWKSLICEL